MTRPAEMQIVLTPLQLAAVLSDGTLEQPSFANRAWGVAGAIVGAIEVVGGGALFVMPEPTFATKIGGGALAVHGVDTVQSNARQVWTGLTTDTVTSDATSALALKLGVDRQTAERIGDGVDIVVPIAISGGFAAARVIRVRNGFFNIVPDEIVGGHTIRKHIYKSEELLRLRLAAEPRIPAASAFGSLVEAELAISTAMRAQRAQVTAWLQVAKVGDKRAFTGFCRNAGAGVIRSTNQYVRMNHVLFVLRKRQVQGRFYYVLTAFPTPP